MCSPAWHDVVLGHLAAVRLVAGQATPATTTPAWVLPGSFNPRHSGHDLMAAWVSRNHKAMPEFEISIENVEPHKPSLAAEVIQHRLGSFGAHDVVWVTRASTFVEKSQLFPAATFLVGADTMRRIADPAYYVAGAAGVQRAIEQFAQAGCRFLVFGRLLDERFCTLAELQLPHALRALCRTVPGDQFRADVSSTELRRSRS